MALICEQQEDVSCLHSLGLNFILQCGNACPQKVGLEESSLVFGSEEDEMALSPALNPTEQLWNHVEYAVVPD